MTSAAIPLRYAAFSLLIGGLLCSRVEAQESSVPTISGYVVDGNTGNGLPSASVAIWMLPRTTSGETTLATGAITRADGRFEISGLRAGSYRVVASFVGYVSESIETVELVRGAPNADVGTITLNEDVALLEEVEVAAERQGVEFQIDRTVYNVADDPLAQVGTVTTILENIPSVDVDIDGNVSLRGVSNVAILINGRAAPVSGDFLAAYLQSLPASAIASVEVIPNPSARYEPDGMGGILNLVLKEDVELGIGGALTAGGDSQGGGSVSGLLAYNRGPITVTSSYGFRRNVRESDGGRFRINRYLDPETSLDQDILDIRTNTSHFGSITADYAISDNSLFTIAGQAGYRGEGEDESTTFVELDATENPTLSYERLGDASGSGWNGDVRLGFRQDFGTPSQGEAPSEDGGGFRGRRGGHGRGGRGGQSGGGPPTGLGSHTLSAEARFDISSNADENILTEQLLNDAGDILELQQTSDGSDRSEGSLQIDYVRPLLEIGTETRIEIGYRGEIERLRSDFFSETFDDSLGTYVPDNALNNAFDYDQQIHAAYLQFATKLGALGVQLGLRAETATTTFTLQNTSEAFDNNYTSLFPSVFFVYEVTTNTALRASYSRRINRPRTWYLNPFPSVDDPLNIRQGNPFLRPEYVDAVELGFVQYVGIGSLQLTPYYRRTTDVIRRFQLLGDDGVTTSTFENLAENDSYGVEFVASFRTGIVRGSASIEGFKTVTDGSNVDSDLENNSFGWGGRLNSTFSVREGMDVQASVRYRAPMNTEQGSTGARTFVNLGLRQRFLDDRASLSVQLRDPFDTGRFESIFDQPRLYQEFSRSFGGRQLGVSLTYAFGQQDRQRRNNGPEGGGEGFEDVGLDG